MVQAGHCGRCRSEMGVQGSVCKHCHLDDLFLAWEVRLYSLQTRAAAAGGLVTAEDALRQVPCRCRKPQASKQANGCIMQACAQHLSHMLTRGVCLEAGKH